MIRFNTMFNSPLFLLAIAVVAAHACEEPKRCRKNQRMCGTHMKFREMCPCTCAPDINYSKCCAHQKFEHEECRQLCTYDLSNKTMELKYKTLGFICFNDFFKALYCSSNGHAHTTECCLKNGVTKDMPGKAGCSVFCDVKIPSCSRIFEYSHCGIGEQLAKMVKCVREKYDRPRWKADATGVMCAM